MKTDIVGNRCHPQAKASSARHTARGMRQEHILEPYKRSKINFKPIKNLGENLRDPHLIDKLRPCRFVLVLRGRTQSRTTDCLLGQKQQCALDQQQPDIHDAKDIATHKSHNKRVDCKRNTSAKDLKEK